MEATAQRLEETIDTFLGEHQGVTSASRAISPLLEIWELANALDRSVAEPVEALLTALVTRELTTDKELSGVMDQVRGALVAFSASQLPVPAGV